MKILVVNCGSSTLKFRLLEADGDRPNSPRRAPLAHGIIDRIGGEADIEFVSERRESLRETVPVADHGEATGRLLDWLEGSNLFEPDGLRALGHRVVHGGHRFVEPVLIDDRVVREIEEISQLAPLHNEPSLRAIRAAGARLGDAVPMVAVFDTSFHRTLPQWASQYAIPEELARKHHIRRYGFHGIAHRYMTERYAAIASAPVGAVRLVTLQLGNGCSAAAVEGGRAVDTSMGLTPLEGLMMGTRCGDVDPSLAGFLARREAVDVAEAEDWLNTRSGLLGVSGRSRDMRDLLDAEAQGDARASLAVEMFCYRVCKCIGAYLAALGGADAVVFGGGIGENAPAIRTRICAGMEWCGLKLDRNHNATAIGTEALISTDDSRVRAYVIPVDEAAIIAKDTIRCLDSKRARSNERVP